jgi:hypothetical protein
MPSRITTPKYIRQRAGFRYACHNPLGHTPILEDGVPFVVVYEAEEAGLDPAGGRWVTVCEAHGFLVNHERLALARDFACEPEAWCDRCQDALGVIGKLVAHLRHRG